MNKFYSETHDLLKEILKHLTPDYYDLLGTLGIVLIVRDIGIFLGTGLAVLSILHKVIQIRRDILRDKYEKAERENFKKKNQNANS